MTDRIPTDTAGYRSYLQPDQITERVAPPSLMVALSELTSARKRALWQWMRANDPATADYLAGLKSNSDVLELEAAFGPVRPVVSIDYVREAIG